MALSMSLSQKFEWRCPVCRGRYEPEKREDMIVVVLLFGLAANSGLCPWCFVKLTPARYKKACERFGRWLKGT